MLLSRTQLEEMTGFSFQELDVQLFETGSQFYEYDLSKNDFHLLFERIRELSYEQGRYNAQETALYQQYGN